MKRSRAAHAPLIMASSYAAVVLLLCRPNPWELAPFIARYAASLWSVWLMVGLLALVWRLVMLDRRGSPASAASIAAGFINDRWRRDRCASILMPWATVVLLLASYNLFKQVALPRAGFWFGPYAASADRMLLGTDAWRITHRMLPTPWASLGFDLAYHCWFLPMMVGVALCSFVSPGSRLAQRYLVSYILLWVVQGSIIAFLVPAAGPCFYHAFQAEPARFAELGRVLAQDHAFLIAHGAPGLYAVQYQNGLLSLFGGQTLAIGGGISAMPSLHNALAVLFACAGWSLSRRLGLLATGYAAVIWLGSIHLGWHYAVDGVVAAGLTVLTWVAVDRFVTGRGRDGAAEALVTAPATGVPGPLLPLPIDDELAPALATVPVTARVVH